jgi:predicted MFS family arabinose efflux permease
MKNSWHNTYLMIALLIFSHMLIFCMDSIIYFVIGSIRSDLELSDTQARLVYGASIFGMAVMSIPIGYLLRTANRKWVAVAGLLVSSLATIATAFCHSFEAIFIARLTMGFGLALNTLATLAIGLSYFSRYRTNVIAIEQFSAGVGLVLGLNIGVILGETLEWRETSTILTSAGLLTAAALSLCLKPWLSQARANINLQVQHTHNTLSKTIWSKRPIMLGAITVLISLAYFSYPVMFASYLQEKGDFTWQAGEMTVSLFAAGNLFALYGPSLVKKFGAKTLLLRVLLLTAALSTLLFTNFGYSTTLQVIFSVYLGMAISVTLVTLSSEMVNAVIPSQSTPAIGLFTACLCAPIIVPAPLMRAIQEIAGWDVAGMVSISASLLLATLITSQLQKEQYLSARHH